MGGHRGALLRGTPAARKHSACGPLMPSHTTRHNMSVYSPRWTAEAPCVLELGPSPAAALPAPRWPPLGPNGAHACCSARQAAHHPRCRAPHQPAAKHTHKRPLGAESLLGRHPGRFCAEIDPHATTKEGDSSRGGSFSGRAPSYHAAGCRLPAWPIAWTPSARIKGAQTSVTR